MENQDEAIKSLCRAHENKKLRILVGAGASIQAGFPSWDKLNKNLLKAQLDQERGVSSAHEDEAARLFTALGRDAVADYVHAKIHDESKWHRAVAAALYEDRPLEQLPVLSVHRRVAYMAFDNARNDLVYTMNFDPLLEMAFAERDTQNLNRFIDYRRKPQDPPASAPKVTRLHGWVDPDGEPGGTLIFKESDYFNLHDASDAAANALTELLNEGTLLIVGMSLADPNLRRLLHKRKAKALRDTQNQVFAALRRPSQVEVDFWKAKDLRVIPLSEYDELSNHLRAIEFGAEEKGHIPSWLKKSNHEVEERAHDVYSEHWQNNAYEALRRVRSWIRKRFAVRFEEHIHLSLFAPLSGKFIKNGMTGFEGNRDRPPPDDEPLLSRIATTRGSMTPEGARKMSFIHRFRLLTGEEEGLAGFAFAGGVARHGGEGDKLVDRNFPRGAPPWQKEESLTNSPDNWRPREWRTALAVPLLGPPEWLPLACTVITSNLTEPFFSWPGRTSEASDLAVELESVCNAVARTLLFSRAS